MNKLLLLFLITISGAYAQGSGPFLASSEPDTIHWYSVSEWGVEGRGWTDVKRFYDRLPAKAETMVRDKVWDLSHHSAGLSCRFATDAMEIHVRYLLLHPRLEMAHMPATGVSGVDLYTKLESGAWQWIGTVQPADRRVSARIIRGMSAERRTYLLNLPLYNGIDSLSIGVPTSARFEPIAPRAEKPVVFYGTSIMQGACASRPGMAIPALLGRRLNVPVINLGFSGNGKMEIPVGRLMAEIDAAVYVIDCLPNLTPAETAERTEPFVQLLRTARPTVPILLVEDRLFPNAAVLPDVRKAHVERQTALRESFDRLRAAGMKDLYYLEGKELLGSDGEATVDGSHPSDLGMERYADAYENVLRPILTGR